MIGIDKTLKQVRIFTKPCENNIAPPISELGRVQKSKKTALNHLFSVRFQNLDNSRLRQLYADRKARKKHQATQARILPHPCLGLLFIRNPAARLDYTPQEGLTDGLEKIRKRK